MRNINEISKRLLEMHAYLQHGEYVLQNAKMTKQDRCDAEILLGQVVAEIDLLRWVLGLGEETWFDGIDLPVCVQHL